MTRELTSHLEALEALVSEPDGISSKTMAKELVKARKMGSMEKIMAQCILGLADSVGKLEASSKRKKPAPPKKPAGTNG